ncbi:uncharacterized protein [Euphorbia lathyris]|uniref:uncharacterized protein n=1 Tax=Euphorbia lathyris TaxID=212925 RepID=UPI00331310C6
MITTLVDDVLNYGDKRILEFELNKIRFNMSSTGIEHCNGNSRPICSMKISFMISWLRVTYQFSENINSNFYSQGSSCSFVRAKWNIDRNHYKMWNLKRMYRTYQDFILLLDL